jgi:hypothetical protein
MKRAPASTANGSGLSEVPRHEMFKPVNSFHTIASQRMQSTLNQSAIEQLAGTAANSADLQTSYE